MRRPANPAAKINIADRSPAWTGTGCYISPYPVVIAPNYRRRRHGDAVIDRMHVMPRAGGSTVNCDPTLCRECERERTWHDHGEVEA